MKCPNCGEQLPEGAKFCGVCGNILAETIQESPNPDASDEQEEQSAAHKFRKNYVLPAILIAMVVAVIIAVNVIIAMMPTDEERWQEQYDLGEQYLLEGDYEKAIVAFTKAIELDPNSAEAYIGRADAYYAFTLSLSETTADSTSSPGILQAEHEEYLRLALSDYEKARSLSASSGGVAVYIGMANIYMDLGNVQAAVEILEEGREANPDAVVIQEYLAGLNFADGGEDTEEDFDGLESVNGEAENDSDDREEENVNTEMQSGDEYSELVVEFWDELLEFVEVLKEGAENVDADEWYSEDLYYRLMELESGRGSWELEDGKYLSIIRGLNHSAGGSITGIYYGDLEDGERNGSGIWATCELYDEGAGFNTYIYEGEWSEDFPNGEGVYCETIWYYEEADEYGGEEGVYYETEYYGSWGQYATFWRLTETLEYVDGRGDGVGTLHGIGTYGNVWFDDTCEIEVVDGYYQEIYTVPGTTRSVVAYLEGSDGKERYAPLYSFSIVP